MPVNENAPDAGQGIEGNEIRTNTHEGTDSMAQLTATATLPEQIGEDWTELTDFERDCLHELDGAGINLSLLRYLAAASTGNRAEVA
ncbi:hypothetical protein [Rhodococcus opacus]|uniref:Uncharacterized protein n=1 Tax=Rhodococcus opacus (strain B4) TaxID=632772 RepID=C1B979_RHOOB|nr:hypothetical protein [Rhodococcus opacus]BAH52232.1 hypothetical protein ROP_39850 [Rhodococcus opacus B4]